MPLTGCFERRLYVALFGASSRSTYAQASLAESLKVMAARMIGEASITVPLARQQSSPRLDCLGPRSFQPDSVSCRRIRERYPCGEATRLLLIPPPDARC